MDRHRTCSLLLGRRVHFSRSTTVLRLLHHARLGCAWHCVLGCSLPPACLTWPVVFASLTCRCMACHAGNITAALICQLLSPCSCSQARQLPISSCLSFA